MDECRGLTVIYWLWVEHIRLGSRLILSDERQSDRRCQSRHTQLWYDAPPSRCHKTERQYNISLWLQIMTVSLRSVTSHSPEHPAEAFVNDLTQFVTSLVWRHSSRVHVIVFVIHRRVPVDDVRLTRASTVDRVVLRRSDECVTAIAWFLSEIEVRDTGYGVCLMGSVTRVSVGIVTTMEYLWDRNGVNDEVPFIDTVSAVLIAA